MNTQRTAIRWLTAFLLLASIGCAPQRQWIGGLGQAGLQRESPIAPASYSGGGYPPADAGSMSTLHDSGNCFT